MFSGSTFVRKFNLPEFPGIVSHDARTQRDIEGLREKGAVTHGSQAIVKAIRDKRE